MKRSFFFTLLILSFISCNSPERNNEAKDTGRPNIVFLIADDWSYPHAGAYGDAVVRTPMFDRLAQEGALFNNAYCAAPSCSPSRAAILTGRYPHEMEAAGNLWSVIPEKFANWVDLLNRAGYYTGKTRKGWGPGDFISGGYAHNPAGKDYPGFKEFLEQKPGDQPFCFWFGSSDPHRDYVANTGLQSGMSPGLVDVPGFLPDMACIRNDILDYYFEVERFDRESGQILTALEDEGMLDNTIVIMTSDNGMPFPRAKANLYDYGTRMPLAIRWPSRIAKGTIINDFVNFIDLAPSLLEAAGLRIPVEMKGQSLWPLLSSSPAPVKGRDFVFLERERHANVRKGNLSYPMRGIRNRQYLYIRNLIPDRWPAGDPEVHQSVGQFGDVDNSISKFLVMDMQNDHGTAGLDYFQLSFGKRPPEELYDVVADPYQLINLAEDPSHSEIRRQLRDTLQAWMEKTNDPRAVDPQSVYWDTVRYVPDYQYVNFNLTKEIGDYRIKSPDEPEASTGIPCKIPE